VQLPQSPFLQLYFGLNPALAQADFIADPSGTDTVLEGKFNFTFAESAVGWWGPDRGLNAGGEFVKSCVDGK